jgi:sugar O-acyltransferase (sialic acid O-acetyltransferase NeuD family)
MKKNLYIVGAGDFGRELESWLKLSPDFQIEFQIKGYLDDDPSSLDNYPSSYSIISSITDFKFNENDYVLVTITDPLIRKEIIQKLHGKVKYYSYIAPDVIIGKDTVIGEGVIICYNSIISNNTKIGAFVIMNVGCKIGHDCIIKDYSSLMASIDLGGHVELGEGVFLGTKATIIPQKKITDNIKIGAGSVVIKNLKKQGTYFGNPAKKISY